MNNNSLSNSFLLMVSHLIFIVLGVLTLLFFLQRLIGDPATVLAGHTASPEMLAAIRTDMGLDEPLIFLRNALALDFGESIRYQQPALELVTNRFPATLILSFSAIALAIIIGIPLGIYAAIYHHRLDGRLINLLAGVMQAVPNFWWGVILLLIFSIKLQWVGSVANLQDNLLKRIALPTVTLSTFYIARLTHLVRSGLLDDMNQLYVLTAIKQ